MARLPGMVQVVVVQITALAPTSSGWGADLTGNLTQMVTDLCG